MIGVKEPNTIHCNTDVAIISDQQMILTSFTREVKTTSEITPSVIVISWESKALMYLFILYLFDQICNDEALKTLM